MARPHHCLATQKLQSTYFNVLYAYPSINQSINQSIEFVESAPASIHQVYFRHSP